MTHVQIREAIERELEALQRSGAIQGDVELIACSLSQIVQRVADDAQRECLDLARRRATEWGSLPPAGPEESRWKAAHHRALSRLATRSRASA